MGQFVLLLSLCHCVALVWGQSPTATFLSSATALSLHNVDKVSVKNRTETELILEWNKVNNISNYRLNYDDKNINISGSEGDSVVTHTVSSLSPGSKYTFTLYTVFGEVDSSGFTFTSVTAPSNVNRVSVKNRTETELILEWNKVNNISNYRLNYDDKNINISGSEGDSVVTHTVSSLSPGTKYTFTLYTVFEEVESSGFTFTSVTTPSNVDSVSVKNRTKTELILEWNKVNNNKSYNYTLNYDDKNINISGSEGDSVVTHTVSSLSPGTKYNFTLFTVFEEVKSSGFNFINVTTPSNVDGVSVKNRTETELILKWSKVSNTNNNSYSYRLNYKDENIIIISGSEGDSVVTHTVSSLSPGTKYTFTLYTVFEEVESSGFIFTSVTTPSNVNRVSVKNRTETELILEWNKVNDISNYRLNYDDKNINISGSEGDSVVTHTVSSLSPGTKYTFILYTVFEEVESSGLTFTSVTAPSNVNRVSVKNRTETELILEWNKVNNISNYRLNYDDKNINISGSEGDSVVTHTVSSLSPGTKYTFTLYTVFEEVESSGLTFTSVTTPSNVDSVSIKNRTENELILEWDKVNNNNNNSYSYRLNYDDKNINISGSEGDSVVTHTVSSLSSGTKYSFTLYTVFEGVESIGFTFINVTTPSNVDSVSVKSRTETELILEWNKVNNNNKYNYRLNSNDKTIISGSDGDSVVTHKISSLSPGTKYTFTLYTVFEGVDSSGLTITSVTTPSCANNVSIKNRTKTELTFEWNKVNNKNSYNYRLNYDDKNINISGSEGDSVVTHTVSSLSPGTKYNFTLYTVFEEVESSGFIFTNVTTPTTVTGLHCEYAFGGYGLVLVWDPPIGERTYVQVYINARDLKEYGERLSIDGLQPTQWYTLTATAVSWDIQSDSVSVNCQADPRGVIAGVLVFLLLAILILCIGIYIWRYKPKLPSVLRKSTSSVEIKISSDKYKPIPLKKFAEHFNFMSRDEKRGFSEEYEDLSSVGTDQSRTASLLPENKSKNRFTNVLAYDLSRVKLTDQNSPGSDYINANYMSGYDNNSKQYIAAQGPLPSTVNDFWRMVWEQKSNAIVMLTNCTESGKIKCEQYWPLDYTPCVYGNLLVIIQSELKEKSWTLREFLVKNKKTSEERTVTHFHFTVWPDHGVPIGTDELIQFRGIVRQHIESFPFTRPTVVHCSAGVGRTGTLIALDILMQQMMNEEAVSIAACVHRMRLNRPLMVQTESQYVFLHQCILDSLQHQDSTQESIYENSDMIYANAMVLQQYSASNSGV